MAKAASACSTVVLKDILLQTTEAALLFAVKLQREDVVKLLLESGERLDRTDSSGKLPLEIALKCGQTSIISTLLTHGAADVNGTLPDTRDTMLHVAVGLNDRYVCKKLEHVQTLV